jgi:hypothetical protein
MDGAPSHAAHSERTMKTWSPLVLLLLTAGCGGGNVGPTSSPTPVPAPPMPSLVLDADTLTVARHETGEVHASYGVPGSTLGVTLVTRWTSSNAQVVTIDGGVVTAVGLGTATVSAEYEGQTKTVTVTVRRRMWLTGEITVRDVNGQRSLDSLVASLDGRPYGSSSGPDCCGEPTLQIFWLKEWMSDPINRIDLGVRPGTHEFSLVVAAFAVPPGTRTTEPTVASDPSARLQIFDSDTSESLVIMVLPVLQKVIVEDPQRGGFATLNWTVQIPVFSS